MIQLSWPPSGGYDCWKAPRAEPEGNPLAINQALAAHYDALLAERRQQQRRQALQHRLQR